VRAEGGEYRRLTILLVGEAARPEFAAAREAMEAWGEVAEFSRAEAAVAYLDRGEFVPDVIVAAQAFPGEISHAALDHLRRRAPLARVVGLLGSWCEGEVRTGSPWPGAARAYWHQWSVRSGRQFRRLARAERCAWSLPPTATEEERLVADRFDGSGQGLVLIRSRCGEMGQWLSAACRRQGFSTIVQRGPSSDRVEGAAAALFDLGRIDAAECEELSRWAESLGSAPVVALASFPRIDDHRRLLSAGAQAVLSKPLTLGDLYAQLESLLSS